MGGVGGMEFAVFTGDGEAFDDAAIVNSADCFVESQGDAAVFDFGFGHDGRFPTKCFLQAVFGGQGPTGDTLSGGDFELGMIPTTAEVIEVPSPGSKYPVD